MRTRPSFAQSENNTLLNTSMEISVPGFLEVNLKKVRLKGSRRGVFVLRKKQQLSLSHLPPPIPPPFSLKTIINCCSHLLLPFYFLLLPFNFFFWSLVLFFSFLVAFFTIFTGPPRLAASLKSSKTQNVTSISFFDTLVALIL